AGAGRQEVALQGGEVGTDVPGELDVDDVEALVAVHRGVHAIGDGPDVLPAGDHALRVEEARSELEVGSRRAHGHRRGATGPGGEQPDLERLLGGQTVGALTAALEVHGQHPD